MSSSSSSLPFPTLENVSSRFAYDQFEDFIGEGKFGNVYIATDNEPHYYSSYPNSPTPSYGGGGGISSSSDTNPNANIPHISSTTADDACGGGFMIDNNNNNNQKVALKVVEKYKLENAKAFSDIVNEVELARRVKHPNCVAVLDAVQSDDRIFIVQELIEGSDLQVLVSSQRGLPEPLVQAMAAQLLYALSCLHKQNIVHRDVKPENIMLSGEAIPVIGDDSRDLFDGSLQQDQYLDAAKMTLVDFGLAKSLPKSSNANSVGGGGTAGKKRVVVGGSSSSSSQQQHHHQGSTSMFTMTSTTTNRISSLSRPTENSLPPPPTSSQNNQNNQVHNTNSNNASSPSIAPSSSSTSVSKCEEDSSTPSCSQMSNATNLEPSLSQPSNNTNNNNSNDPTKQPSSPTINVFGGNNNNLHQPQQKSSSSSSSGNTTDNNSIGLFPMVSNVDAAVLNTTNNNTNNNTNNTNNTSLSSLPRQNSLQSLPGTNSPMVMTPCGTFGYSAPELMRHLASMGVNQKQQTNRQEVYKRDIYSVGLVLYYAICGKTPFNVKTAAALAKQMENGPSFAGPHWDKVSLDGKNFISLLLSNLPEARPSADVALAHPWVSGLVQKLKAKYHNNNRDSQHQIIGNSSGSNSSGSGNNLLLLAGASGMLKINNNHNNHNNSNSSDIAISEEPSETNSNNTNNQITMMRTPSTTSNGGGGGGMLPMQSSNMIMSSSLQHHHGGGGGNISTNTNITTTRRKNNGRSYEDLTALHELRTSEAREFDAICSANYLDELGDVSCGDDDGNGNNGNNSNHHDPDQVVVSEQDEIKNGCNTKNNNRQQNHFETTTVSEGRVSQD